jgi:hypothetical protein
VPVTAAEHGGAPLSSHDAHEPEHVEPEQGPDDPELLDDALELDDALPLDDALELDDALLEVLEAPPVSPPSTPPVPFAPPLPVELPPAPGEPPAPPAEDVLDPDPPEEVVVDADPLGAEVPHASWAASAPAVASTV